MSRISKKIIAGAVVLLFVLIAVFNTIYKSEKVVIPEGTIGATAGNINNLGLFCEYNGKVYFSNSYDEGCLYVMDPEQTNVKKLYNLKVKYINAGGNFLFFYGDTVTQSTGLGSVVAKPGMYMIKNDGSKLSALTKDATGSMILSGSKIFYEHYLRDFGTVLSVMDLKTKKSENLQEAMINPACAYSDKIYFNGVTENHHLFTLDTNTYEIKDIWGGEVWNPIVSDGYVYYMDVMNDYRLCRYSLSSNTIEILTKDRIDFFNIYSNVIFYQKSSATAPSLHRMLADGSSNEVIAEGVYNNINMTSTYTYFGEFGNYYTTYCTPTFGPANVTEFTNAKMAIYTGVK